MPKPTPIETPALNALIEQLESIGSCDGLSPFAFDLIVEAKQTPELYKKYYIGIDYLLEALKEIKIVINN